MSKFEPRLEIAIEQSKSRAASAGMSVADVDEQEMFEVTISHHETLLAAETEDRVGGLADLERAVSRSEAPVVSLLREEFGIDPTVHTLANAVTTRLTPQQMARVAELDEVKLLRLEAPDHVTCMDQSPTVIEVPQAREDFGLSGRGVKVAVLDSGIDSNHPALVGKVVDEVSTANEPTSVPGAHGTHVAGTIASNDAVFRGVAFQCDLINIKVLTAAGFGEP